jgi:hypothetical protein
VNQDLDLPLSAYALFYLQLTKRERKIFQYLRWYQNRYQENSFPKMAKIALFSGLSIRGVQKFFAKLKQKKVKEFYLTVNPRYNKRGGNTTNQYILNRYFKMSMNWLELHGFLNSPKKKIESIILSMQNGEKVHPPTPQKFTPLSKDYSSSKEFKEQEASIHHLLKGIKIDQAVKIWATEKASDYEIYISLESCHYRQHHGGVRNPTGYFLGTLKNIMYKKRTF